VPDFVSKGKITLLPLRAENYKEVVFQRFLNKTSSCELANIMPDMACLK